MVCRSLGVSRLTGWVPNVPLVGVRSRAGAINQLQIRIEYIHVAVRSKEILSPYT
jgi:hypothetical protein